MGRSVYSLKFNTNTLLLRTTFKHNVIPSFGRKCLKVVRKRRLYLERITCASCCSQRQHFVLCTTRTILLFCNRLSQRMLWITLKSDWINFLLHASTAKVYQNPKINLVCGIEARNIPFQYAKHMHERR